MIEKIKNILAAEVPNFYTNVWEWQGLGDKYIGIFIAASDYDINQVKNQKPQAVSLSLCLNDLELRPQVYGGNGGQSIYREPNPNDPAEKYLWGKSVKVPFRKPQPNEAAVLKAIAKFCQNYKQTLINNIDVLKYRDIVDYKALLNV